MTATRVAYHADAKEFQKAIDPILRIARAAEENRDAKRTRKGGQALARFLGGG